jgi:hypothetical protein
MRHIWDKLVLYDRFRAFGAIVYIFVLRHGRCGLME